MSTFDYEPHGYQPNEQHPQHNPVRGIQKGQIEDVALASGHAEVRMWVESEVSLNSDMRVSLQSRELMGGKQVVVDPGTSGRPALLDHIFHGEIVGDIGAFFARTETLLSKADSLLGHFNTLMEQTTFEGVLLSVEEAADEARDMIAENRRDVRLAVDRLEDISRRFQEDSTAHRFGHLVTGLDSTVFVMRRIAIQMESEEGTVGKLIHDRWLYDQLMKTAVDLDSLISDLKENPKKYIHFSLF